MHFKQTGDSYAVPTDQVSSVQLVIHKWLEALNKALLTFSIGKIYFWSAARKIVVHPWLKTMFCNFWVAVTLLKRPICIQG